MRVYFENRQYALAWLQKRLTVQTQEWITTNKTAERLEKRWGGTGAPRP